MSAHTRRCLWFILCLYTGSLPLGISAFQWWSQIALVPVDAWPWLVAGSAVAGFAWAKFMEACK